jgi:hypothetical protein
LISGKKPNIRFSYAWWQDENLQDRHSLIADPKCPNWKKDDFSVSPDSPALDLGFELFHLDDVGPRKQTGRDHPTGLERRAEEKPEGHIE